MSRGGADQRLDLALYIIQSYTQDGTSWLLFGFSSPVEEVESDKAKLDSHDP